MKSNKGIKVERARTETEFKQSLAILVWIKMKVAVNDQRQDIHALKKPN